MHLIRKRLALHRTSHRLRTLWAEYVKVSESSYTFDAVKLRALSSFMENILDSDVQLPSVMDELFDDASVIVTGLLDVVQKLSVQMLTDENGELEQSDFQFLGEAVRKTLLVGELYLHEEKNRVKMKSVPNIIRFAPSSLHRSRCRSDFDDVNICR